MTSAATKDKTVFFADLVGQYRASHSKCLYTLSRGEGHDYAIVERDEKGIVLGRMSGRFIRLGDYLYMEWTAPVNKAATGDKNALLPTGYTDLVRQFKVIRPQRDVVHLIWRVTLEDRKVTLWTYNGKSQPIEQHPDIGTEETVIRHDGRVQKGHMISMKPELLQTFLTNNAQEFSVRDGVLERTGDVR